MNAYQLADELQKMFVGEEYDRLVHEIPDLLRQQAKEIAMLKQIIDANNLQSDVGQFIKPIDEPVAWTTDKLDTNEWEEGDYQITVTKEKWSKKQIPLYTHPMRELTDEEITEIGLAHGAFFTESKHHLWGDDLEIHDFARAILKKASEK